MRVYRTLLVLYPRSFRHAYGEDMVAVFEEMRRDRSPAALWWRVLIDAFSSVIIQRLETPMSKNSMLRPAVLAGVAFTLLVALTATGVDSMPLFLGSVLLVQGPWIFLPAASSFGSGDPAVCDGVVVLPASAAQLAALGAGTELYTQVFGLDPFQTDGTFASLSDGLRFKVIP